MTFTSNKRFYSTMQSKGLKHYFVIDIIMKILVTLKDDLKNEVNIFFESLFYINYVKHW